MKTKYISFTDVRKVEFLEKELGGVRKIIGAHNMVRPKMESYPHHWTHQDDCKSILDMIAAKRIQELPIVSKVESSENAAEIYNQLCDDKDFPMGTVFVWKKV